MRVLFVGPVFPARDAGGLPLALADVGSELSTRGWDVDIRITESSGPRGGLAPTTAGSALTEWHHVSHWRAVWNLLPDWLRDAASGLAMPAHRWASLSDNLETMDGLLADPDRYDVVIVCVDAATPGALALAIARHPRVVALSLGGLARELRRPARPWRLVRRAGRHPFLARPVRANQIERAVFASEAWRREAVSAGLPERASHVIYFGVRVPAERPTVRRTGARLLWVGRFAEQKGLQLLLLALPHVRRVRPDVRLTVIGSPGAPGYQAAMRDCARACGVDAVVDWQPPCSREDLAAVYAEHDVLFFHSPYDEPVALVLMEAFAAGLPVVASLPRVEGGLVRSGVTCGTYDPRKPSTVEGSLVAALVDRDAAKRMADAAFVLVRDHYSLTAMGEAWNRFLL